MAHKFFNRVFSAGTLPSRIASSSYARIKKVAHSVWAPGSGGNAIMRQVAERDELIDKSVHDDDTKDDVPGIAPGSIIMLLMGGRPYRASITSIADGMATINTDEGDTLDIPTDWAILADDYGDITYKFRPSGSQFDSGPSENRLGFLEKYYNGKLAWTNPRPMRKQEFLRYVQSLGGRIEM